MYPQAVQLTLTKTKKMKTTATIKMCLEIEVEVEGNYHHATLGNREEPTESEEFEIYSVKWGSIDITKQLESDKTTDWLAIEQDCLEALGNGESPNEQW